jgi:hypothetical protein
MIGSSRDHDATESVNTILRSSGLDGFLDLSSLNNDNTR